MDKRLGRCQRRRPEECFLPRRHHFQICVLYGAGCGSNFWFLRAGTSGGGAAIGFALAQYGLSDYFDYIVIGAGPGVARLDYGCDKSLYTGPPLNLCPLLTNAPYAFTSGV